MGHNTFTPVVATAATPRLSVLAALAGKAATPEVLRGVLGAPRPIAVPRPKPAVAPAPRKEKAAAAHHACRCGEFRTAKGDSTGCGGATTARTFAPGHDAKLSSLLQRAAVAGELVWDDKAGAEVPALQVASWFPFGIKVAARVVAVQAKQGAVRDRDAANRR